MTEIEEPELEIQTNLIQREKIKQRHPLLDGEYTEIGGNGLIQTDPSILTFGGFAINKMHTKRVLIRNTSIHPKRIHIIPPNTPAFKMDHKAKGGVAAGMSQEVYIIFCPKDYKYHYDNIKVHSEGENILIPIYAFPVMNPNIRELVPKIIDMGIRECGSVKKKTLTLTNTIPVTFEFQINVTKNSHYIDIKPLMGDIEGEGSVDIEIMFSPKEPKTISCEFEFKLSEYEFEPLFSRVSGSGIRPMMDRNARTQSQFGQSLKELQEEVEQTPESSMIKSKGKTLLTRKLKRPPSAGIKLPKLNREKDQEKKDIVVETIKPKNVLKQEVNLTEGIHPNVLISEDNFIRQYRRLENLEREKEIKFFSCLGDPAISEFQINKIQNHREENEEFRLNNIKEKDRNRHGIEVENDKVIIDKELQLDVHPKWDVYANDQFSLRSRYSTIFLKAANIVLTRIRANNRLQKLKAAIEKANVQTREDARRFVAEDWKQTLTSNRTEKTYVDFSFNLKNRKIELQRMVTEYDINIQSLKEQVEGEIITSFDDNINFHPIEPLDFEIMNYQQFPLPPASNYFPLHSQKHIRPGAENEYYVREMRGDPDLTEHKEQEQKKVEEQELEMPCTFLKPLEFDKKRLILPHASLRKFVPYKGFSEVDVEFPFYPRQIERKEIVDELLMNNKIRGFKGPMLELPGYSSIRTLDCFPVSNLDIYKPRFQIPECIALGNFGAHDGKILPDKKQIDQFTESDSEDQNAFQMKRSELQDLISEFEAGDTVMQKFHENEEPKNEEEESLKLVNTNISMMRISWGSKMGTAMEDFNEHIEYAKNKVSLL